MTRLSRWSKVSDAVVFVGSSERGLIRFITTTRNSVGSGVAPAVTPVAEGEGASGTGVMMVTSSSPPQAEAMASSTARIEAAAHNLSIDSQPATLLHWRGEGKKGTRNVLPFLPRAPPGGGGGGKKVRKNPPRLPAPRGGRHSSVVYRRARPPGPGG